MKIKKFLINMYYSAKILGFVLGALGAVFYLWLAAYNIWLHLGQMYHWILANPKGTLWCVVGFVGLCGFCALVGWFEEWVKNEESKPDEQAKTEE